MRKKTEFSAAYQIAKEIKDAGENHQKINFTLTGDLSKDPFLVEALDRLGKGKVENKTFEQLFSLIKAELLQMLVKYFRPNPPDHARMETELDEFLPDGLLKIIEGKLDRVRTQLDERLIEPGTAANKMYRLLAVRDIVHHDPELTTWLFESAKGDVLLHFEQKKIAELVKEAAVLNPFLLNTHATPTNEA